MHRHLKPGEYGAGALGVITMVLLVASLAVLYLNRHLLIEHRTSVNQWHGATALEAAEAGLAWAQDRLNHPGQLDARCRPATVGASGTDFRLSHLPTGPLRAPSAGCRLPGGALDCACPAEGQVWAGDTVARFVVRLTPDNGSDAIRAHTLGCAADDAPCDADAPAPPDADARSQLSVALRPVPLLPSLPVAALTCGGDCRLLDQASLRNDQIAGLGMAVHAAISLGRAPGTQVRGLPGSPLADASVENDLSLASAAGSPCNADTLFAHVFQQTLANYARSPLTHHLACPADTDCGSHLRQAHALGWRAFFLPNGAHLSGGEALGSPEAPLALVSAGALVIDSSPVIHGLLFANESVINAHDGGAARIRGAVVSCNSHRQGGLSEVAHDGDTLLQLRKITRAYQRVPGSWRDAP